MTASYLFLAVVVIMGSSLYQSVRLGGTGSVHPVHVFLATVIRERGHRLLTRIPRLLNEAYCSAYPIFLHWILSFLSPRGMELASLFLNPAMNAVVIIVTYAFVVYAAPNAAALAGIAALVLALTPQYYHAASARNYGLSSRSVGMVLLTVFLSFGELMSGRDVAVSVMIAAGIVGYLIWGFNTFAQQAMVLFAIILAVRTYAWGILAAALVSLLLFVLLHFRYATAYLVHTFAHVKAYARDLAPVFILHDRFSVWRDLVYDIWKALRKSIAKGIWYAYNNAVLIVLFLNPLVVMGAVIAFMPAFAGEPLIRYCSEVSLAGMVVFLATSLRSTRFLGEPERYVELVAPFGTIASVGFLLNHGEPLLIGGVIAYFLAADIAQFIPTIMMRGRASQSSGDLGAIDLAIKEHFRNEDVRFTSNNDQLTKFFMKNPWSFVRLWSADTSYGAFPFRDVARAFPLIGREPFEEVAVSCRTNVLLLDRSHFDTVFEHRPDIASRLQCLMENSKYRLYRLRWSES